MNNHIGLNGNSLHRLDDSTTTEGGQSLVKDYNYDALGNLTFKTGLGSYVYNYTSGRPHAPTSIAGKSQTYGRQRQPDRRLELHPRANPRHLQLVQLQPTQDLPSLGRTPDLPELLLRCQPPTLQTAQQQLWQGHPLHRGLYEKATQGGTVTHTHYIKAGGQLVALYKSATSGESTRYVHSDTPESPRVCRRLYFLRG